MYCGVLQRVAACCSVLQRVAGRRGVGRRSVAAYCSVLQCATMCCRVEELRGRHGVARRSVAAYCGVLQCVAACCVLQCVAVSKRLYGRCLVALTSEFVVLCCDVLQYVL